MNSEQTIRNLLDEFNLLPLYSGHRLHGDYPLLTLNGTLSADRLIESAHFTYVGHLHGQLTELWAGERVTFTTQNDFTTITTTDPALQAMVETHVKLAIKDIRQALLLNFTDEDPLAPLPIEQSWRAAVEADLGLDEIFEVMERQEEEDREFRRTSLPEGGLQSLSREERLDRARALKGRYVRDSLDVRASAQAAEKQLLFALTFKPMDDTDPLDPLYGGKRTEEEWAAYDAETHEMLICEAQPRASLAEGQFYSDDDLRD